MEDPALPADRRTQGPLIWGFPLAFVSYVAWLILATALGFVVIIWSVDTPSGYRVTGPLALSLIAVVALLLIRRGRIRIALRVLLSGMWLTVSVALFFFGGLRGTLVVIYPLIVFASGWLLGIQSALLAAGLSGAATLALMAGELSGALPAHATSSALLYALIQLACIAFSTLLIVSLVRSYKARLHEVTALSNHLAERTNQAQRSAADLAHVQEIAHIGSWILDCDSDRIHLSPQTCRIFNLPPEASSTRSAYLSLIHPDDLPTLAAAWESALKGHPLINEHRTTIQHKQHWIRLQGEIEFGASQNPLRCVGSVQDITPTKLAEEELRIAATAFEAQQGMLITNADQVILRVNHSFSSVTGYSSTDAVGQTPRLLKSGRHDSVFYAAMWAQINDKGAWAGEIWNRRKNGEVYPEWLTITAVRNEYGTVTHYVGTLTDISQRKATEDEFRHLAFYDALTRLPNRRLLLDRLQQALAASARSGRQGALLFLDLDNFKQLNDTRGHDIGDLLLQQVANRLASCIREEDTAARFGGDEFVIMLGDLSTTIAESKIQAETVAHKILASLRTPYDLGDERYRTTASIGITLFENHEATPFELLKQADLAMYAAKGAGRDTIAFFEASPRVTIQARMNNTG